MMKGLALLIPGGLSVRPTLATEQLGFSRASEHPERKRQERTPVPQ